MGAPEDEHIFGVQLRESADDGSDFTNADADYRKLFLGEDGQLHVKDSAGTVTDIGGSVADILDLPTAETDTALVLAPDGIGGVEFRAETGGGGATGVRYPVQVKTGTSGNSTTNAVTVTAVTTSNKMLVVTANESTHAVSGIACTNTSFSKLAGTTVGVAPVIELWVGTVSGSPSGTTVTTTFAGTSFCNSAVLEWDSLAGTLDDSASRNTTTDPNGVHVIPILTPGDASAVIIAAATTTNNSNQFSNFIGVWCVMAVTNTLGVAYGFAGTNTVFGSMVGGSSGTASGLTASVI